MNQGYEAKESGEPGRSDPAGEGRRILEAAFRHNPSPMALSSVSDRRFLYVNDAFLELTGYRREDVIGQSAHELGLFADPGAAQIVSDHMREEGRITNCELRIRGKDGSLRHGLFFGERINDGAFSYNLTTMHDISDRKQAHSRIAFQAQVLEHVGVAVVVTDLEGRILYWGPGAEELYGYRAEEALDRPYHEVAGSVDRADEHTFRELLLARGSWHGEHRQRTKAGGTFWSSTHIFLLRDEAGQPIGYIGVDHDISERKAAEEDVRHRESLLVAAARIGQILASVQGPGNALTEVIRLLGEASGQDRAYLFERVPHTPPDDVVMSMTQEWVRPGISAQHNNPGLQNMPFAQVAPETCARLRQGMTVCLAVRDMPASERVLLEEQGIISIFLMPVMRDTEFRGFIGFDNCRTNYAWTPAERSALAIVAASLGGAMARWGAEAEKVRLHEQLIQAQKMDSVGRLAGGVAHDFNNMLGVILGHAELVLRDLPPDQPQRADLLEICAAAERSANLTRQLLAFARKQTVTPRVLDLNETLEGMLKMLRRLIGENLRLSWHPGADLWKVKMDPSQVDQVLANLCVNARDAMRDDGEITISTASVNLDETYCANHVGAYPGAYVRLTVSDNGKGMDAETLSHLFEPFYTTKKMGQGTGLGLATVYGIVKQNNGYIDVQSRPGHGSTFTLYLPRHLGREEVPEEATTPDTPNTASGQGHTVLLVEDDPSVLGMARRQLTALGYQVISATTPAQALSLADQHASQIRVLLTDVVMPEMNGRELSRQLELRSPGLACVYMSGYTADVIARHGVLDENVCFIQKPFSLAGLEAVLNRALGV